MSPQLADSEFSPVFRLLTIFAYGTYADYLGEAGWRGVRGLMGPFPSRRCWSLGAENVPEPRGAATPRPNCPLCLCHCGPSGCGFGPRPQGYLAIVNAPVCHLCGKFPRTS